MSEEKILNIPLLEDKLQKVGTKRRAGILAPLFSVYSKDSIGIGDFADLKLLIDFCAKTGNSILQLLPMNEVGPVFCPYDALSAFALEPAYLNLSQIAQVPAKKINAIRKDFPAGKLYLDYGIKEAKLKLLGEVFQEQKGNAEKRLEKFREENNYWIDDFALFKAIKYYQQGKAWYEWEEQYKFRDRAELEKFKKAHEGELLFQIWLQWQLYQQFSEAKAYAAVKKILIKGDLPVLVSRDSADVWMHPEFFKLEYAAGAPPDMYAALGQRWGMPTYHWENIEKDDYRYLKAKLKYAENFYDLLRIDHVVGLFRIWSIPCDEPPENKGLHGFFDPQDESKWEKHGKKILSAIVNNTKMLICAEDLGIIPKVCPKALEEFGLPGNDVQRWMKDWKIGHDFLPPQAYRLLSVAMLSTHDTTNWAAWWENEAGTVDEELFMSKCAQRKIDYNGVKEKLFDPVFSRHGRLRWLNTISSAAKLVTILGKRKEEVGDFIEIYENSYQEKEKLWHYLKLKGPMREGSDATLIKAALGITLGSRAVFCIESLIDWLYLSDIFKGDSYQYRINRPGTVNEKNWSLVIPISLDDLLRHKVFSQIKKMVSVSFRALPLAKA